MAFLSFFYISFIPIPRDGSNYSQSKFFTHSHSRAAFWRLEWDLLTEIFNVGRKRVPHGIDVPVWWATGDKLNQDGLKGKWKYSTYEASSCLCQETPPFLSSGVVSEQQTHLPAPRSPSPQSTQFPLSVPASELNLVLKANLPWLCRCLFLSCQYWPKHQISVTAEMHLYQFLHPWTPSLSSPAGKRNLFQRTYFYFCLPLKAVSCACGKYHWQLEHLALCCALTYLILSKCRFCLMLLTSQRTKKAF